jgi:hypothetical protein
MIEKAPGKTMTLKSPAAFAALALGVGLLTAPMGVSAATINRQSQLDDSTDSFSVHYLINGVEQLPNTFCSNNENCLLGAGFMVTSSTVAITSTVNFNVYETDMKTLSDYGTAKFLFEPNGSLQDFVISLVSDIDGFSLTSPFTAADNPISLTETGAYQTVSSISGVLDTDGNTNNVALQFRSDVSDVPEPSTLALLGAGLLALVGFGWRRNIRA